MPSINSAPKKVYSVAATKQRMREKLTPEEFEQWMGGRREWRKLHKQKLRRSQGVAPRKCDAHVKLWEGLPSDPRRALRLEAATQDKPKAIEAARLLAESRRLAVLAVGEKKCSKCGECKALEGFFASLARYDQLTNWCKSCDTERVMASRNGCPVNKLKHRIGNLIRFSLKAKGYSKKSATCRILGCSHAEFYAHIEKQFVRGMSWSLMGTRIHIDHIVPLASAKTEEDVLALNHFSNLRPLWAEENLKKSAKSCFLI